MAILFCILGFVTGFLYAFIFFYKPTVIAYESTRRLSSKHLSLYILMKRWLEMKKHGYKLERFFLDRGFNRISIYGMGDVGEMLVEELKDSDISIEYGIDRRDLDSKGIRVIKPEDMFETVDIVVVTAIGDFEAVYDLISQKVNCPILSIEDILFAYESSFYL